MSETYDVPRSCRICRKEYMAGRRNAASGKGHYCSVRCAGLARRNLEQERDALQFQLAAERATVQQLTQERDREKARTDIVIAEFDAPWPHSHTVGDIVGDKLIWEIHQCRAAFETRAEQAEAALDAERALRARLEEALRTLLSFDSVRYVNDDGPHDEGWQSDELSKAMCEADEALAAARGPARPHD